MIFLCRGIQAHQTCTPCLGASSPVWRVPVLKAGKEPTGARGKGDVEAIPMTGMEDCFQSQGKESFGAKGKEVSNPSSWTPDRFIVLQGSCRMFTVQMLIWL